MKKKILELRKEGKTYNQIVKILGCSKSTVSYHCGVGQKEKTKKRTVNLRVSNPIIQKLDNYKTREKKELKKEIKEDREQRCFVEIVRKYQKRNGGIIDKIVKTTFNWNDIVEIYGYDTFCYLSGEPINLLKRNYNFDHKVPVSRGGDNSLDNLGITHEVVNRMKTDLTPEELMEWCKKILEFNGYKVIK
jgi:5-methylcytosine-specific restriction endonuclease McrA